MILVLGLIPVSFEKEDLWAWILNVFVAIVLIAVNLLVATLYKVEKNGKNITIENLWRRSTYPVEALAEIRLLKFVVPYPFNPFIKFTFNDGKSFTGSIPDAFFVYLRRGGIRQYLELLREQWT
jgi:hypothetical protein